VAPSEFTVSGLPDWCSVLFSRREHSAWSTAAGRSGRCRKLRYFRPAATFFRQFVDSAPWRDRTL